jgi:tRNA threonylcarbamoyladenosine biosynthesis protein TsaB
MWILAVDQSTTRAGAALLNAGEVVAETAWEAVRNGARNLATEAAPLLERSGVGPASVSLFAVGLGPGSYSGLRTAVAALRAMALPGGRPVRGIGSAEALAWSLMEDRAAGRVAVVGDARRQRLWVALFERGEGRPVMPAGYRLAAMEELGAMLPPDTLVVSPDWDTIGEGLRASCPADATLLERPCRPRARDVGLLAARLEASGGPCAADGLARRPSDVLSPIYLHPPVTVRGDRAGPGTGS